jgi:hypothetical protein
MNIAYTILAFKNPEQVFRLINSLKAENAYFFIHIDSKVDISDFLKIYEESNRVNIKFSDERFATNWSSFGCVEVLLSLFNEILSFNKKIDYVVTLTGQDYSIKSTKTINDFFVKNVDKVFMEYFKLPSPNWKNGGIDRIKPYHFNIFRNRFLIKVLHKLFIYLNPILPIKKLGLDYVYYGGEAHFGFPVEVVRYIVNFMRSNPQFYWFFRHTYMPDEIVFQTILLNSKYKNIIENNVLKYIDWSKPGVSLPAVLKEEDFSKLVASNKLFARKFDIRVNAKILDLIDGNKDITR